MRKELSIKERCAALVKQVDDSGILNEEYRINDVVELLFNYVDDDKALAVCFNEIRSFFENITCLLTNPSISSQLDTWDQANAAKILRQTLWLFYVLHHNDDIKLFLLYNQIKGVDSGLKSNELDDIEDFIQTQIKENT